MTKGNLGEVRVSLAYRLRSSPQRAGKAGNQGRNWSRHTKQSCLLSCSLVLAQLGFLYSPGPPGQRWHCPHSVGWALQHQSTQPLPDMPTGQSKEGSPATEAPLSRYVRLTTKLSHHNTDTESNWGNWPRRRACKTVPILGEKRGTLFFVTLIIPVVWERYSSRKPGIHLEVLSACVPLSLSSTVAPWRKCAFFCVNSY